MADTKSNGAASPSYYTDEGNHEDQEDLERDSADDAKQEDSQGDGGDQEGQQQEEEAEEVTFPEENLDKEEDDLEEQQQGGEEEEDDARRNLIVNYLPPTVKEIGLLNLFNQFGPIESCKLMVDKHTGQSMGYGFVKYQLESSATAAIQAMNALLLFIVFGFPFHYRKGIDNKRLKVSYARPASTDIKHANLYVARLDPSINSAGLEQLFSPYGKIIESKVLTNPMGQSRGVGFVRFDTRSQAEAAIAALNNVQLPNTTQTLQVKFADTGVDKMKKKRTQQYKQPTVYGPMAHARYSPYGHHHHPAAATAAMYGDMSGMAAAPGAEGMAAMYGAPAPYSHHPHQAPAHHQMQQGGAAGGNGYCLFVYNLAPETDENLMYRLFGPYGAIVNVKVIRNLDSNTCKGYGFVNYVKLEDAQQAILALNGCQMADKILQVSFKTPSQGRRKQDQNAVMLS